MLTSRITVPTPSAPSPEDIFSTAIPSLFTDDTHTSHGSPGEWLIYSSPAYGDITLQIPAHPDVEEGRKLFAHYLWNASVVAAEGIERASVDATRVGREKNGDEHDSGGGGGGEEQRRQQQQQWKPTKWDVRGKRVLELGAGTALPSIISALSNASSVTITDHPSSPALTTGAIQANVAKNLLKTASGTPQVSVRGYVWGTETEYNVDAYGKPAGTLGRHDIVVLADCLWMPSQHQNLVRTIAQALDRGPGCCAIVVAGFHTGRGIVRDFFDVVTNVAECGGVGEEMEAHGGSMSGLVGQRHQEPSTLKIDEIYEVDINGQTREWQKVRPGEAREEAKKWCVVSTLVPT